VTGPELQQVRVLEIMKGIKTALADQSMELRSLMSMIGGMEYQVGNRPGNTVGAQ